MVASPLRPLIAAARARLGIDHLMLTVHDASFPGRAAEDVGRGSPYSRGAEDLLRFAAELGFDNLQLGPQGKTTFGDPSPYNGALFARSHLGLDLARLREDLATRELLDDATLERAVAGRPEGALERAAHGYSWQVLDAACQVAFARFASQPQAFAALGSELQAFAQSNASWLVADGLYEVLCQIHGLDHFSGWCSEPQGELDANLYHPAPGQELAVQQRRRALLTEHAVLINRNAFVQLLLQRQHRALRALAGELGMRLWADFQVGYAARDLWRWRGAFLPDYLLGAPPSRTNPQGQPWGYPVLDPTQLAIDPDAQTIGDAPELLRRRVSRLLSDFDGLRVDHPHGLICPWVYRSDDPDPGRAVREGARLRCSPASADHPELARFAIPGPSDLALTTRSPAPYAEDWVVRLSDAQVTRYARPFELIIAELAKKQRDARDLAAEVLSTCPYPLARVLERHGLGRFRVIQKANPEHDADPYRSERAQPADWIMLGTHDTAPIWRVVPSWSGSGLPEAHGRYLARRLAPSDSERAILATRLAADPRALTHALFADLFVGPARHVCVFFADLFGLTETYNSPGTFGEHNWRLRVPPDFRAHYERHRNEGAALDIAAALATALRARAGGGHGDDADLAAALEVHAAHSARLPR